VTAPAPRGPAPAAAPGPAPKPPVPLWRWASWWAILAAALVVFYVLLVPIWMGLRGAAWVAELRARRARRAGGTDAAA
jgi:hypothetical protein